MAQIKEMPDMTDLLDVQEIGSDKVSSPLIEPRPFERRSEQRYPAKGSVSYRTVHGGRIKERSAQLLDISRSGLKLRSLESIPVGALLLVRLEGASILGEVRYCLPLDGPFFDCGIWIAGVNWNAIRVRLEERAQQKA
jgi:hypothetical protein